MNIHLQEKVIMIQYTQHWLWSGKSRFGGEELHSLTVCPLVSSLIALDVSFIIWKVTYSHFRVVLRVKDTTYVNHSIQCLAYSRHSKVLDLFSYDELKWLGIRYYAKN